MSKEFVIFGRKHTYDFGFEAKEDIAVLNELIEKVQKPLILSYCGLETINLYTDTPDNHFIGKDSIWWLYENERKSADMKIRECLLSCSVEDTDWTAKMNSKYTDIFYRKIEFLPEIKEKLKNMYMQYIPELTNVMNEMILEETKEKKERERRKKKWVQIKVYEEIAPSRDSDGYIDAEYRSESGQIIRMISRDVFDFGCFSFPKRLSNSKKMWARNEYTDEERSLAEWLNEFGEFRGVRM